MSSSSKRYFMKRERSVHESPVIVPEQPETNAVSELPQIPRLIPARVLWGVATTIVYSCIVFFVLIQLNVFFPAPDKSHSFSDDLIDSPLSYRSHLLYLESLVVKNRLEEAQHELNFLKISQNTLTPSQDELATLENLQSSISARKIVFHTTIDEYNAWSEILKSHPDYRDVLYRLGQRSYMLFEDGEARSYISDTVALDPQFDQGKKVLQMLGE